MRQICRSHSVPNRYSLITNHYVGVHDIMFSLYDDEQIQKAMMREAHKEGIKEGRMEGRMEGRVEGRMEGIDAMIANLKNMGVSEEMLRNAANMSQSQRS